MSYLTLNSKVKKICDYKSVDISRFAVPLHADEERLQQDILGFRRQFAQREEVFETAGQDMVTFSCCSSNPKFHKSHLTVRVGLKLFSEELEQKVIGMRVGEEHTITVGGDEVTVTVERIVREILPEITDDFAKYCGLPEVRTAQDIYTYCRYKQYDRILEDPADDAFAYLAGEVISNCEFELDREELELSCREMRRVFNNNSALCGRTLEEISDEEFLEAFGTDKWTFEQNCNKTGMYTVKAAVLGQEMKRKSSCLLTDRDYEEYLEKKATAADRPKDELRAENPICEYKLLTYSDYYMDTMEAYVYKKLKEAGECLHHSDQD